MNTRAADKEDRTEWKLVSEESVYIINIQFNAALKVQMQSYTWHKAADIFTTRKYVYSGLCNFCEEWKLTPHFLG